MTTCIALQSGRHHQPVAAVAGDVALVAAFSDSVGEERRAVIEDDEDGATFLANGIAERGHEADVARNGRDGLVMATGPQRYDVVIVDRMLPELEGSAWSRRCAPLGRRPRRCS